MPDVSCRLTDALGLQCVEAWRRLGPDRAEPERIDILKGPQERKTVCRLLGVGPSGAAVIAKRLRLAKGLIERTIYMEVLPRLPVPTLCCYGMVVEADGQRCWLFLEDAGGEAYLPHHAEHRALAARWLALLHGSAGHLAPVAGLPERGPGYYLECLREARSAIVASRANPALTADDLVVLEAILSLCELLEARWDRVERLSAGMPRTVVHGDFVKKNIRVRASAAGMAFLPFDWSNAGWGVPAADLAQAPTTAARFAARPSLAAYWAVLREHWPGCDLETIREWANLGSVFRSLASLSWAARSLSFDWVEEHIAKMSANGAAIARAMRAAGWAD